MRAEDFIYLLGKFPTLAFADSRSQLTAGYCELSRVHLPSQERLQSNEVGNIFTEICFSFHRLSIFLYT